MNKNILIDHLPETVFVCGRKCPINWGYRACILIEICMFSDRSDEQKLLDALNIFYLDQIPADRQEAMDRLLWFFRCGKEPEKKNPGHGKKPRQVRAYCFEQDAPMIYAAFRTQYGMNLNRTKNKELHWWEFMAMFESLSEDLLISRVMYYRTADLKGLGKNQRAFIKKMRGIYALKHAESSLDDKAKLAKRNADMKEYVRRRMEECARK